MTDPLPYPCFRFSAPYEAGASPLIVHLDYISPHRNWHMRFQTAKPVEEIAATLHEIEHLMASVELRPL